jgi:predicted nucleotidyltransferase
VFTEEARDTLRDRLIAAARADARIVAAAVVGSAAQNRSDRWSDIDLAFRLAEGRDQKETADSWTDQMYAQAGAIDHLDVWSGSALYRVFLLGDSLQVDLSFWPFDAFAATGDAFLLLFGDTNRPLQSVDADRHDLVATGWLYALHARSSIGRDRLLQALHMIDHLRDQIGALMSLSHGLSPLHGRGFDDLSPEARQGLETTIVATLTHSELARALAAAVDLLLAEAYHLDPEQAGLLYEPLRSLAQSL